MVVLVTRWREWGRRATSASVGQVAVLITNATVILVQIRWPSRAALLAEKWTMGQRAGTLGAAEKFLAAVDFFLVAVFFSLAAENRTFAQALCTSEEAKKCDADAQIAEMMG